MTEQTPAGGVLYDPAAFATSGAALAFVGSVLESSTEHSLIATDLGGRIMLWSQGSRRLFGHTADEALGRSMDLLHTPEDVAAGIPGRIRAASLRDGTWAGGLEGLRKDGTRFTAGGALTPRAGCDGTACGFVLVSTDVTAQVCLSRERHAAQGYARSLIESAPDAMVIVGPDGLMQLANAETERLFGHTREELVARPVELLIPRRFHTQHPGHRGDFFAAARSRPMGAGLDLWGVRKDGTEFPVEVSLSPLETYAGTVSMAAIRDVTEARRVQRELRVANLRLEKASRAKDRFLTSMSHELRTPLNAILGFTGTLLMELPGPLNDEQDKQLRIVQTSGRHLLSLINDLLDLARIESGKLEIVPVEIDCRELLGEVALGLRPLAHAKRIALKIEAAADVIVASDRRALSQILINLVSNAIKFTDVGSVRLLLDQDDIAEGRRTRFTVIDTGIGIKPDDQEKLFAAFEQIDRPAHEYEGTGLGLHICQTLAPLLGGTISFRSAFGEGSAFTLELGAVQA
jgi:protein-histidine pros-kinase